MAYHALQSLEPLNFISLPDRPGKWTDIQEFIVFIVLNRQDGEPVHYPDQIEKKLTKPWYQTAMYGDNNYIQLPSLLHFIFEHSLSPKHALFPQICDKFCHLLSPKPKLAEQGIQVDEPTLPDTSVKEEVIENYNDSVDHDDEFVMIRSGQETSISCCSGKLTGDQNWDRMECTTNLHLPLVPPQGTPNASSCHEDINTTRATNNFTHSAEQSAQFTVRNNYTDEQIQDERPADSTQNKAADENVEIDVVSIKFENSPGKEQHHNNPTQDFSPENSQVPNTSTTEAGMQNVRSENLSVPEVDPQTLEEKRYECEKCDKVYSSKQCLRVHIRSVHDGYKKKCSICGDCFNWHSALNYHYKHMHSGQKVQSITVRFADAGSEILRRLPPKRKAKKSLPVDRPLRLFYCECGRSYGANATLKRHRISCKVFKEQMEPNNDSTQSVSSDECENEVGMRIKNSPCMKASSGAVNPTLVTPVTPHRSPAHRINPNPVNAKTSVGIIHDNNNNANMTAGDKALVTDKSVGDRAPEQQQPSTTKTVNNNRQDTSSMTSHAMEVDSNAKQQNPSNPGKPFPCNICGKRFRTRSTLDIHTTGLHSGEKPYVCKHCDARFSWVNSLTVHERTHTGEKPFKCPHCDRIFGARWAMNTHVKKDHFGDSMFKCRVCNRRFPYPYLRKNHEKKHNGGLPLPDNWPN